VQSEATARATADGYLAGKYALTVIAGNVVTGLTITSASAPDGGTVSEIKFQADKFQIYNGTSGVAPFSLVGSDLTLNANVTVNGTLDVGTAIERTVIDGTTFRRGAPTGNRTEVYADSTDGYTTLRSYNSANELVALIGTELAGGHGQLRLHTAAGVETLTLNGDTGRVQFAEVARGGNASASAPTYSFAARTDDGLYSSGAAELSFALGGRQSYRFGRSTEDYVLEIGMGRSGAGAVRIDLIGDTTFTDYGLRIERGGAGANADTNLLHRGTGSFNLTCQELGAWLVMSAEQIHFNGDLYLLGTGGRLVYNDGLQILGGRGAAVSDAATDAPTTADESHSLSGSDTVDLFGLESALNALAAAINAMGGNVNGNGTSFNTLLTRLRPTAGHGLIAA
jgi:hypothetical protein